MPSPTQPTLGPQVESAPIDQTPSTNRPSNKSRPMTTTTAAQKSFKQRGGDAVQSEGELPLRNNRKNANTTARKTESHHVSATHTNVPTVVRRVHAIVHVKQESGSEEEGDYLSGESSPRRQRRATPKKEEDIQGNVSAPSGRNRRLHNAHRQPRAAKGSESEDMENDPNQVNQRAQSSNGRRFRSRNAVNYAEEDYKDESDDYTDEEDELTMEFHVCFFSIHFPMPEILNGACDI